MKKGQILSLLPFSIFVVLTIVLSFTGSISVSLLIAVGILSIFVGAFLFRDGQAYWKTIFHYMGSPVAMTATLLWLVVGIYGNILKEGHLVEGLVWAAQQYEVSSASFTLVVFLFSALFAFSTGSGFGTISAMSLTLFPAGVAMGGSPALLGGAILSGASFGDSIAPVSDTAIIAVSTQEVDAQGRVADIGESIRHRLPYVLTALSLSVLVFLALGYMWNQPVGSLPVSRQESPEGLALLLPTFVVILLSLRKVNIFLSLFAGIVTAVILGRLLHLFTCDSLINIRNGQVSGAVVDGITGMSDICILLMVVVSLSGLVIQSGCMECFSKMVSSCSVRTSRSTDLVILSIVAMAGILIAAVNTIANICIAPFVNSIGKSLHVPPYRRTTLLATVVCTFPFVLPYGGCALLLQKGVETSGCTVVLQTTDIFLTAVYPWILLAVMVLSAVFHHKPSVS